MGSWFVAFPNKWCHDNNTSHHFLIFLHVCPPFFTHPSQTIVVPPYFHSLVDSLRFNTSSPPPTATLPFSTLCVFYTFRFSSYPSLQAIWTIHHYLWTCLSVSLNFLKLNSTISSSWLTSLSPSSLLPLSFTLSLTQQDLYSGCVCVCVCICPSICGLVCLVLPWWRILVLSVPELSILAAVRVLCWRVPVHRPPGSDVTAPHWPCQLAYGACIWGLIYKR